MTCRDVRSTVLASLDDRRPAPSYDRAVDRHLAGCDGCRSFESGQRLLRQALVGWGPPPGPSAGFADRVLAAWAPQAVPFRARIRPAWWSAAGSLAAAALLVAAGLAWRAGHRAAPEPIATPPVVADARPLDAALADATAATWELARSTSAPAGRLGRQVLASASMPEARLSVPVEPPPAAEVFQTVGERVGAGVRPLSGTARQAFSFLLAPAVGPAPAGDGVREL